MGPSGSGKSTFLDVISGRKLAKNITGEILLNGVSNPKALKKVSAYVLQDDSLLGNLTVRENILFSALFSMKSNIPYQIKKQRVEAIINEFGLKRVAESYIGTPIMRGISGGEKRRTSIACQLVTIPQVIFIDEPTSGLDSAASLHTMQKIVDLAKQYNLTVIATIH
jgi:ATP-binding cassette subfamily G (WHITE) protein 2